MVFSYYMSFHFIYIFKIIMVIYGTSEPPHKEVVSEGETTHTRHDAYLSLSELRLDSSATIFLAASLLGLPLPTTDK